MDEFAEEAAENVSTAPPPRKPPERLQYYFPTPPTRGYSYTPPQRLEYYFPPSPTRGYSYTPPQREALEKFILWVGWVPIKCFAVMTPFGPLRVVMHPLFGPSLMISTPFGWVPLPLILLARAQ